MIVVFAGRRARSIAGDLGAARLRVRRLLTSLAPSAVIGAAADGGDLLVLEAALGMAGGPAVHVILPTSEDVFREQSVDAAARPQLHRVIAEARRRGSVQSLELEDGEDAYARANVAFLDRAAERAAAGERIVVLAIAREGEGEMVETLVEAAALRDIPALRIDPDADIAGRPQAFVAMPYGVKHDPQRGISVDCDLVDRKILVPALETVQLHDRRGDEQIDSGVVLEPMIEWIARSDVVIGDLQTANVNVGWELGLRHVIRAGHTLLIRPAAGTWDALRERLARGAARDGRAVDRRRLPRRRRAAPAEGRPRQHVVAAGLPGAAGTAGGEPGAGAGRSAERDGSRGSVAPRTLFRGTEVACC